MTNLSVLHILIRVEMFKGEDRKGTSQEINTGIFCLTCWQKTPTEKNSTKPFPTNGAQRTSNVALFQWAQTRVTPHRIAPLI